MKTLWFKKIKLKLFRLRGIFFRAFICWLISIVFLLFDENNNFDFRLKIRSPQKADEQIVLIHSKPNLIIENNFFALNEIANKKPKLIIINSDLYNLSDQSAALNKILLKHKNIIVSTGESYLRQKRLSFPKLSERFALNSIYIDNDGIIRRHKTQRDEYILDLALNRLGHSSSLGSERDSIINFRGPKNTYLTHSLDSITLDELKQLKDKIVILEVNKKYNRYRTPVGSMSKSEIAANILDNELNNQWIYKTPLILNAFVLAFVTGIGVFIMFTYPQVISFIIISWFSTLLSALSIWLFDSFYIWVPAFTPLCILFIIYMIFIGYQLTLRENENLRLEQERKSLLEVEELKNNFVSLISHDLKTPIAKIQAIVDHLKTKPESQSILSDLGSLRAESSELHKYIHSILKVTRLEASDVKLNLKPCDLNKIIEKIVNQLKPLLKEKNLAINTQLEPLFLVDLDHTLIHEILLNILENAIKYSYKNEQIIVTTQEKDESVIVTIQDFGPGISKTEHEKIFKKFHRGSNQNQKTKGTGLGLYLVKYFVELHSGEVKIESDIGQGTKFIIILPIG